MNYYPNTRQWQVGDLVIHDYDAKRIDMLMRVIGYNPKTGHCITVYAFPEIRAKSDCPYADIVKVAKWVKAKARQKYENECRYLHAPERFGLEATQ